MDKYLNLDIWTPKAFGQEFGMSVLPFSLDVYALTYNLIQFTTRSTEVKNQPTFVFFCFFFPGSEIADVVNCRTGVVIEKFKVGDFWEGFESIKGLFVNVLLIIWCS